MARSSLPFSHERGVHVDPTFDESYLRFESDSRIAGPFLHLLAEALRTRARRVDESNERVEHLVAVPVGRSLESVARPLRGAP